MTKNTLCIGIDGNEANVINRVGSNHYAYELLKSFYSITFYSGLNVHYHIYLKSPPVSDLPKASSTWRYRVLSPAKAWTQWRLPLDLYYHRPRPDVFFSPGHYAPRFSPIPSVVTILDLAFLTYPNLFLKGKRGYYQLKNWTAYSVSKAAHLISISQCTKDDISRTYGIAPSKITVAYPGINFHQFSPAPLSDISKVCQKYKLKQPYILYVGTLQPRKNLVRLVHAFDSLPDRYRHYTLVLAGQTGWHTTELTQVINRSKAKTRIILPGYIDKFDLPALYSGASVQVMIGLYEGFGIPPAEAISCGTLPIVSGTGALREVVGDKAIIVDPFSLTSIKQGIIKAIIMPKAEKASRLGSLRQHINQFTWENTAQTILKVIYDVAFPR